MKIQFIGTGSAFTLDNFQSNALMTFDNGYRLLLDCGSDARHALKRHTKVSHVDINGVYISHLHGDHCGGLEWLGFVTHFDPRCKRPDLFISRSLVGDLWTRTLSGGMSSLQNEVNSLESYYHVHQINKNGGFVIDGVSFTLVQVVHIMNGFDLEFSYGLIITLPNGKKIFHTTDTQFCPAQIMDFYKSVDVIVHDCECTPYKSGVHAHFDDLATLPAEIKKKMHLTHYQDTVLSNIDEWNKKAEEAGFAGFIYPGAEMEF